MDFNRLGAFTLGVVITAVSVGAVSFVNAAGDKTLKACANKKTGVMRYIAKGSCKKTETSLSWNQMGAQGSPGLKGDTGPTGASGENFHVIDATGRDLGSAVPVNDQFAWVKHEGGLWEVGNDHGFPTGTLRPSHFYLDSLCTVNLALGFSEVTSESRGWNGNLTSPMFWKMKGETFKFSNANRIIYAKVGFSNCVSSTTPGFNYFLTGSFDTDPLLLEVTEVTPPAYTGPFTLVAK
jgi:hypothetical protein